MTWWTTDVDLRNAIYADGIDDLVDLKFYENRSNGQSKGYGLAVFSTENALRQCMDKLPLKELHGQPLVVLPYTKTSLAKFEEATRRSDQRQDKKQQSTTDKKDDSCTAIPSLSCQRPPIPLQSLAARLPSLLTNTMPPPPSLVPPMMMLNRPPSVYAMQQQQHVVSMPPRNVLPPCFPPPGAHINPQVCVVLHCNII